MFGGRVFQQTVGIPMSTNYVPLLADLEPQALKYRINGEIYNPYAGAAEMLLHINGKFTVG
jgi:hypothetical protein